MSDYEDNMDVDAGASKNAVQFSSDNTGAKHKRVAADLPVEAQDNLPWYGCNWYTRLAQMADHVQGGKVPPEHPR